MSLARANQNKLYELWGPTLTDADNYSLAIPNGVHSAFYAPLLMASVRSEESTFRDRFSADIFYTEWIGVNMAASALAETVIGLRQTTQQPIVSAHYDALGALYEDLIGGVYIEGGSSAGAKLLALISHANRAFDNSLGCLRSISSEDRVLIARASTRALAYASKVKLNTAPIIPLPTKASDLKPIKLKDTA